ncbi:endonuclease YncB(thermonuclease family) [Neorhizobium galegae]|uniref:thermonuclease family protein n=1 Tax=Neorhizobium galegae TaxID=399 RepID=UPI001AEB3633|nr:endonuclease YncB(thermonuclease family) [Neorhizobium galegae]
MTTIRRKDRIVLRNGRTAGAVLCLVLLLGTLTMLLRREETRLTGPFRVVDGDTLALGQQRLRLAGIDAPELAQTCGVETLGANGWPCGRQARKALAQLMAAGAPECRGSSVDRYGRLLVNCTSDQGSINAAMVRAGMAVASGGGPYGHEQALAQKDHAGLWQAQFEMPRLWRERQGMAQDEDEAGQVWQWIMRFLQTLWIAPTAPAKSG